MYQSLEDRLIKLGATNPELRVHIRPLLRFASQQVATYKGRTYKLLYLGKTKFGDKAKLGFMDGSKEFWVDAHLVTTAKAPPASCPVPLRRKQDKKYVCDECGDWVLPGTSCWETGCIH